MLIPALRSREEQKHWRERGPTPLAVWRGAGVGELPARGTAAKGRSAGRGSSCLFMLQLLLPLPLPLQLLLLFLLWLLLPLLRPLRLLLWLLRPLLLLPPLLLPLPLGQPGAQGKCRRAWPPTPGQMHQGGVPDPMSPPSTLSHSATAETSEDWAQKGRAACAASPQATGRWQQPKAPCWDRRHTGMSWTKR